MERGEAVSTNSHWILLAACVFIFQLRMASSPMSAHDPGVRPGGADSGGPVAGLTAAQLEYFVAGRDAFAEAETIGDGLGPRMNLDSCGGCHAQPAVGGSSPARNPQFAFASQDGAADLVPPFILPNGPVREARFILNRNGTPDGGVHELFTISGRTGAAGCGLRQPDFDAELANRNVVFRIPTPVFGGGLIEQIPDGALLANRARNAAVKNALGIGGRANVNDTARTTAGRANTARNDGTVARFGWKAQNKSLLLFSGEAYNVEMGISNELFPTERDETSSCQLAPAPNSVTDMEAIRTTEILSSVEKVAIFMRLLAPPARSADTPGGVTSITNGNSIFEAIGCALCHTPSFTTGNSTIAALRNKRVDLFSDLLVHDMGAALADGISQGDAHGREFRTAPLWGLGKRVFFLHDGRTSDLIAAIRAHGSSGSEANGVIANFAGLTDGQKQDLLNFLRAL